MQNNQTSGMAGLTVKKSEYTKDNHKSSSSSLYSPTQLKMEALLDAADTLASNECPARPDFPIPEGLPFSHKQVQELLVLNESTAKGKGWFARKNIPPGTVLVVAKPLAMAMDWQDDGGPEPDNDEEDEDLEKQIEPSLNSIIFRQLLKDMRETPSIWTEQLTELFPRNEEDLAALPSWSCEDAEISQQIETLVQDISRVPELRTVVNDISKRLPLIIRYNVLSVETCPELLSHPGPGGHAPLGGAGLYYLPSFFNHSAHPNVSRWAVGDVMWFVANQEIAAGAEACISYIEHDVLCESTYRRNNMLQMDFTDQEQGGNENAEAEEDGPDLPVVDSEVQNELMEIPDSFERLNAIEELLLQAQGLSNPDDSDNMDDDKSDIMESSDTGWFQCDIQNLRILKAITLEGLGQSREALELWGQCVDFAETKLPPLDESSIVMRVQAALCALHLDKVDEAKAHAQKALATHDELFGGGPYRLRRRYQNDFKLSIRPGSKQKEFLGCAPIDFLWPI